MPPSPRRAKQGLVNEVFARVARRYDLMNDLMSGGLHRLWKDELIGWLAPPKGACLTPCSTLPGAPATSPRASCKPPGSGARAVICDISAEMIEAGRGRAGKARNGLTFVRGNAEACPSPQRSFDAYTIAFGMRNLTHLEAALAEAFRVLKPGGPVPLPRILRGRDAAPRYALRCLFHSMRSRRSAPWLPATAPSYRYLVESIRRFPDQKSFMGMIENAGFERVRYRNLTGGHRGNPLRLAAYDEQ